MSGYIIKVTMEGTHPPMWRRLVVPDKIQFADLHDILQIAFGWEEDHPHDFSFADYVRMRDWQEDSLCIDHLLTSCKWIRYTYDFGDNWRHKIEFEKQQEDYQERFAQVLKYRFNNYLEDSGGIWGREDDEWVREEYNLEAVNQRLQKYKFPQRMTGKEAEKFEIKILKKQSQKSMMKDFCTKFRKDAEKFLEKYNTENTQITELDKQIKEWKLFLNTQENIACEKENEMGSMHRQLMQLGGVQLRDYVIYQNLTVKANASKEDLAAKLVTFWGENPKYLLYVLEKEEYQTIKAMWSAKRKRVIKEDQFSALIKGMMLGLIELIKVQVSGLNIIQIRFTAEADAMMQKLEQTKIDDVYRTLKTFETNVLFYMNTYQILEVDTLYQMYTKVWESKLTVEEFIRRLYWHLRMLSHVLTGRYGSSQKAFVFTDRVDFEKVISIRNKAADTIEYLPYSKDELQMWKRGLGEVIYEWKFVFEMLAYRFQIGEETARVSVDEDFFNMQNGMSVTEMCKAYEEVLPLKTLGDYTELWYQMMSVSMETSLGFLKGYSRYQYMKLPETNIRNTNLFSYHLLAGKVEPKTHLFELPWEAQLALYGMLCETMPDEKNRTKVMEFIDNREVLYMVADQMIHHCQYAEAQTYLKTLKRLCKDSSVLELEKSLTEIQQIDDDDEDWDFPFMPEAFYDEAPKQEPYRRETVKVGRNDPCPCGSGKKYKKCCGR